MTINGFDTPTDSKGVGGCAQTFDGDSMRKVSGAIDTYTAAYRPPTAEWMNPLTTVCKMNDTI